MTGHPPPRPSAEDTLHVLVVRPASSGGLAGHVCEELAILRAAGHDALEAPVRIRERPDLLEDLRTVRTLRGLRRGGNPVPAIHAHGLRAGALAALAVAGPLGILSGPRRGRRPQPLVVTLHNRTIGSRLTRAVGAVLLRILCRGADTVLAVSPDLAEAARRAGARDVRHAVITAPALGTALAGGAEPPVPASAAAHSEDDDPARELRVLVLARLAPQKGLSTLLDAVALLRGGGPLRVDIAGDGPLEAELRARILAERLPVELLGHSAEVASLLRGADVLVSSAVWEGQPLSLQEALRAGLPIIATDAGGTRWVTGEAARLVPVGDPAALAAAILRLRSPQERRRAAEASRRRARELPTAEDLHAQLLDVLAPARRG